MSAILPWPRITLLKVIIYLAELKTIRRLLKIYIQVNPIYFDVFLFYFFFFFLLISDHNDVVIIWWFLTLILFSNHDRGENQNICKLTADNSLLF